MKNKKKSGFTENKYRNQKWTEPEVGRPIDFAEKYVEGDGVSDKYDYKRAKKNNDKKKKERQKKRLKRTAAVLLAVIFVTVGYIAADVHIIRHEMPLVRFENAQNEEGGNVTNSAVSFKALQVESVSLDSAVMLTSIIGEANHIGYTGIAFDAKRDDGTVGYDSSLASVSSFDAVTAPASGLKASVNELRANGILPVAEICCYKDNLVPSVSPDMALMKDGRVYVDSENNTYLNPDSDAAYEYIKDIIGELSSYGINVFILSGCDLPSEISDEYNDGFKVLSDKLKSDLKYDINLFEGVYVSIGGSDMQNANVERDIQSFSKLSQGQVYVISTKLEKSYFEELLENNGVENYIIDII